MEKTGAVETDRQELKKLCGKVSWAMTRLACTAILSEAAASPKPGLVDRFNNGAHSDMDFYSFINSSAALCETFYKISETPFIFGEKTPESMLASLKEIGIEGEKNMYQATGGVNTHKGLIFSLGLLCAAAAWLIREGEKEILPEKICSCAGSIVRKDIEAYLLSLKNRPASAVTKGERLFLLQGVGGARAEAAGGFKTALFGYEVLKKNLSAGKDYNLSLLDTLMRIMEKADDTNIPGRKGMEALDYARKEAACYLEQGSVFSDSNLSGLKKMDSSFIAAGISPGGCADILALSIFLYLAEKEFQGKFLSWL